MARKFEEEREDELDGVMPSAQQKPIEVELDEEDIKRLKLLRGPSGIYNPFAQLAI